MSTEFQDAAQGEYEDYVRQPRMNVGTVRDRIAEAFMDAAHWARRYEAGRGPSDAEVDAVTDRLYAERVPDTTQGLVRQVLDAHRRVRMAGIEGEG